MVVRVVLFVVRRTQELLAPRMLYEYTNASDGTPIVVILLKNGRPVPVVDVQQKPLSVRISAGLGEERQASFLWSYSVTLIRCSSVGRDDQLDV